MTSSSRQYPFSYSIGGELTLVFSFRFTWILLVVFQKQIHGFWCLLGRLPGFCVTLENHFKDTIYTQRKSTYFRIYFNDNKYHQKKERNFWADTINSFTQVSIIHLGPFIRQNLGFFVCLIFVLLIMSIYLCI